MNKPYSNKALPAGTVLREWRLEEVLGVGGFGIVYKGRGIYFDELVAIKEYFPSSISERDADDTVVPIDSDAEEVHALGLKKFVEEAKLLWNLSTPTRHPNIVSVRSLFEIHGTAYMVMDFEDGLALSKMLKQGTKFNERSLWNIIRPIAEGLERAHRVGVLHRDIKPPNILINEDGRPVLIDFGSARFEAAEATSTKVTFHTPPYAAIEQYVKTYPQGPWTDIYALGVVLYECVTGHKPPEVLERMHAGLGERLSGGNWPGYSKKFLAAIDAAMTIRPQERPQSIAEWLEMFGGGARKSKRVVSDPTEGDETTRIFTKELVSEEIVPVAPPVTGFSDGEPIETQVPADTNAVVFKGAGQETGVKKKAADAGSGAAVATSRKPARSSSRETPGIAAKPTDASEAASERPAATKKRLSPALVGGAAAALLVVGAGGWALLGSRDDAAADALESSASSSGASVSVSDVSMLAPATKALADEASKAGAPVSAVTDLTAASDQLTQLYQRLQALARDPAQAAAVSQREAEMRQLTTSAVGNFSVAMLRDAEAKVERLSAAAPWADPRNANAAAREPERRQQLANDLRTSLVQLRSVADAASKATSPPQAIDYARLALAQSQNFTAASLTAYKEQETALASGAGEANKVEKRPAEAVAEPSQRRPLAPQAAKPVIASSASSATSLSPGKIGEINSIVDDGRSMAKQVIRMGKRPGSNAQSTQVLKANAELARTYDQNLAALKNSARGVNSDREADRLIAQAKQTRAYVQFLLNQSNKAR
jgi:non-specific serine/threonine protein kinase